MYTRNLLSVLPLIASSHALKLLISAYGPEPYGSIGTVSTLSLASGSKNLEVVHKNQDCGPLPSWLELSPDKTKVLCVDEFDTPGGVTMLSVDGDGKLAKLYNASTLGGPVSGAFFGKDHNSVALAHYQPAGISTFGVANNNTFQVLQNFTFPENITNPPVPDRQKTAHVHQALLDPTGQFVLFPDLGADLVRVYRVDLAHGSLKEESPLKAKPGYGPRHAVFWQPQGKPWETKLFLLHELTNKIVSYNVTYADCGGLTFSEVAEFSMFGDRQPPAGAGAAEILTSPDNKFLLASNRLAPIFSVPNPDPKNATQIQSDSIVSFKPLESGRLEFVQLVASGGMKPRHFSLNAKGDKVAVANGASQNVVVYQRNVETGKLGEAIASAHGLGDVTNVRWLDE